MTLHAVWEIDAAAFTTALLVGEARCPCCDHMVTTKRLTEIYLHVSEPYGPEIIMVFHLRRSLMKDDPVEPLVPCQGSEQMLRPVRP